MRMMLRGKVHRATVTQADLDYIGSITIDETLMEAAGIVEWEQVQVLDVTNGARLMTYAIAGPAGSGVIGINGAAAHLVHVGDIVIVLNYEGVPAERVAAHRPRLVHVDGANHMVDLLETNVALVQSVGEQAGAQSKLTALRGEA
ncbi:MAG: aspartate 1-decarboxylase [Chloroflexi bacterium]|nr:aspartate 1-decarboxylase [Chloroflexota bacterium]